MELKADNQFSHELLLHVYEADFGLFHQSIREEFFTKCRNFKINFWVDREDDENEKNFLVTIQNSTNNEPDIIQYALNQHFFNNFEYKFQKINIKDIKHRKVLDWKIETLHSKEKQLPMLVEVINQYL